MGAPLRTVRRDLHLHTMREAGRAMTQPNISKEDEKGVFSMKRHPVYDKHGIKVLPMPKTPKAKVESRIANGRCVFTGKIPYGKKKAEGLASVLTPDDRGSWSGYKCPYGKSHWHIGHDATEVSNDTE